MLVTIVVLRCFRGFEDNRVSARSSSGATQRPEEPPRVRRVRYYKREKGVHKCVDADFFTDGREDRFSENEELDEWSNVAFVPTPEERRAARRLPDVVVQPSIPLLLFLHVPECVTWEPRNLFAAHN